MWGGFRGFLSHLSRVSGILSLEIQRNSSNRGNNGIVLISINSNNMKKTSGHMGSSPKKCGTLTKTPSQRDPPPIEGYSNLRASGRHLLYDRIRVPYTEIPYILPLWNYLEGRGGLSKQSFYRLLSIIIPTRARFGVLITYESTF